MFPTHIWLAVVDAIFGQVDSTVEPISVSNHSKWLLSGNELVHERRNRIGGVHRLLMAVHKFIIGLFIEAILAKNIRFIKVYPMILAKVLCCPFPWCLTQKALELNSKIFKESHLNLQAVTCQNGMRKFYTILKVVQMIDTRFNIKTTFFPHSLFIYFFFIFGIY